MVQSTLSFAHTTDSTSLYRLQLQQLLVERQQNFSSYAQTLDKRSGIFGNKTKQDIGRSHEILRQLITTDNRIIDVLNKVVDLRNYEKTVLSYGIVEKKQTLENLIHATDTLNKQVTRLKESNDSLKTQNKKLTWIIYILSLLPLILVILRMRRRKKHLPDSGNKIP